MRIFNSLEEKEFELPPKFSSAERKQFFAISKSIEEVLQKLGTPTNKVFFLVTMGYFKATRKFFARQCVKADIEFVARQLEINLQEIHIKNYSKVTYLRHQKLILSHFGYSEFNQTAKNFAITEIKTLVQVQYRPKVILLELIEVLIRKRISLPSYNILANLIVTILHQHQQMLSETVSKSLDKNQCLKLDKLLEKDLDDDGNAGKFYQITSLKNTSQSTKTVKTKSNLNDLNVLQPLYLEFGPLIARLNLSSESIRYYAHLVIKAQIPQISRRSSAMRYLCLISFIAYQTFKLNDTLIDVLLNSVQNVVNVAQKQQKETYFKERDQRSQSFSEQMEQLQLKIQTTLSTIKNIVSDNDLNNNQKIALIDSTLAIEQAKFESKPSKTKIHNEQDYFEVLETHALKLQRRISDIVRHIKFDQNSSNSSLFKALRHYQSCAGNIDKTAPSEFLKTQEIEALTTSDSKFSISLYKILLFIKTAKAIKSGALNLLYSEKYRSLDDYLIPKADWTLHRAAYLEQAKLTAFSDCQITLQALELELDKQYQQVNQNFKTGSNPYLTLRTNGTVHVKTPKQEEIECKPLGSFFPNRKYVSMLEMLATVNRVTNFLDEFEHWQVKYQREKPAPKVFFAGIIGYGCDIGHRKLAQISKQLSENELENTTNWYFSLQNIQNANDRILQFISQMNFPIEHHESLHTSSDGQKVEVNVDSLNANYSFKYFGKNKGVSVITFIDSRGLMWYSTVINSAEREAAYVIDGLMHNTVIKSDIHSTDTHGYSEVIFGATHLLGFQFAPRIKGLSKQKLYAFKSRKHYEELEYTLLPNQKINVSLIENQWDEILRFIATIQLKVTTASQLFKRLNSYSNQHLLYRALKEFGKISKSLFILKYRDNCEFRQSIESQLNIVENSNKFSKAISFGHNQEFIQGEKEDQEIAESCRRLIKNAIVCWNYLYLSQQLEREKNDERKAQLLEAIQHGSVMTWAHFNLHGEFDFSDEKMLDSVGLSFPKKSHPKTT
jgi:TnpA family transposase